MEQQSGFMVDIHSHILWGLDDGASSVEESVAMAQLAAQTGTTDLVATPHANNHYVFDPQLIQERAAELTEATGGNPRIHTGCDFHLSFSNIESALEDPRPYTVNQSRYLMVELPETTIPADMGTVFERMLQRGILPVITHPERNRALWKDERLFESWLEIGCYVQITGQSLEGHFGQTAKKLAWRLIRENKMHFVASDGHDLARRPPRLDRAYALVMEEYDKTLAEQLFVINPQSVLSSAPLATISKEQKKKRKFSWFHR